MAMINKLSGYTLNFLRTDPYYSMLGYLFHTFGTYFTEVFQHSCADKDSPFGESLEEI